LANVDLTSATADPVEIQTESKIAATGTTVVGSGTDMDVVSDIGAGFSVNEKIYMRYDVVNATFAADLTATITGGNLDNVVVSQGGLEGDTWVVYSATVGAGGNSQTDDITLDLGTNGVDVDDQDDVLVIYGLYESLSAAANGNNSVAEDSGTLITFKSGITITSSNTTSLFDGAVTTASALVAEVENDFKNFGGTTPITTVQLGSVTIADSGARPPDGSPVAGTTVYAAAATSPRSTLTLSGDFNLLLNAATTPAYVTANAYLGDGDCTTGAEIAADSATADTAVFSIAPGAAAGYDDFGSYAVCLTAGGDNAIHESDYSITFDGVSIDATAYDPVAGVEMAMGSIARNGVVVQIPYLTTFEGYRQRIIIVNRNAAPVHIAGMTFTPEEGATATSMLTAADMMIEANKSKILLVEDIVEISGDRTRTAASLSIVAKSGTIDVATQQVNLGDGATDTVEYTAN